MSSLVYFSSASNNTHRFVEKLGLPAQRIPLRPTEPFLHVTEPYVLVVPTYGGGNEGGAVPRQVVKFLNDTANRALIRGVIAAGNTNFGEAYCIAGRSSRPSAASPTCTASSSWERTRTCSASETDWNGCGSDSH